MFSKTKVVIYSLKEMERWFFKNDNPVVCFSCSKGEYSVGLAERYPNKKILLESILKELVLWGAKQLLKVPKM
jgi:hypothetical protein